MTKGDRFIVTSGSAEQRTWSGIGEVSIGTYGTILGTNNGHVKSGHVAVKFDNLPSPVEIHPDAFKGEDPDTYGWAINLANITKAELELANSYEERISNLESEVAEIRELVNLIIGLPPAGSINEHLFNLHRICIRCGCSETAIREYGWDCDATKFNS